MAKLLAGKMSRGKYLSLPESRKKRQWHVSRSLTVKDQQRGIELWSNPGDTILSPFAGIGSEGFVAIQNGRKFIGAELKRTYFNQAVENLRQARRSMGDMFDVA
jgi:hypothetical protein